MRRGGRHLVPPGPDGASSDQQKTATDNRLHADHFDPFAGKGLLRTTFARNAPMPHSASSPSGAPKLSDLIPKRIARLLGERPTLPFESNDDLGGSSPQIRHPSPSLQTSIRPKQQSLWDADGAYTSGPDHGRERGAQSRDTLTSLPEPVPGYFRI